MTAKTFLKMLQSHQLEGFVDSGMDGGLLAVFRQKTFVEPSFTMMRWLL